MKFLPLFAAAGLVVASAFGQTPATPSANTDIFIPANLHAWCVVPFDAAKRGPEERAQMLEKLGFKRFVYDWRAKDIPTFAQEIEATKKHGIEITAWWSPTNPKDPVLQQLLDTFRAEGVHPQLWVNGGGTPTNSPEEQTKRVNEEAERIHQIVKLAEPYGCHVELYNHNNWYGQPDNQVAIIEKLKELGVSGVGMVYNFSHGHKDVADFPAIWKRIQPYVVAVNVTGMTPEGEGKIVPPSQGEFEVGMMRVIAQSGWHGPVGLIAEQGGDAAITLGNNLRGLEWCRKEVAQAGSGGAKPVPAPQAFQAPAGQERLSNVVYAKHGDRELHVEILRPQVVPEKPMPAVVMVHGGGWSGGTHLVYMPWLVSRGYFTMSVEYRLSGEAPWPAQIEDCREAIRWLRAHAQEYHIDPDRIGVIGHSAGGHLVSCLGVYGDKSEFDHDTNGISSRVQAVVDEAGPSDFAPGARPIGDDRKPDSGPVAGITKLFGGTYEERPAVYLRASPSKQVTKDTPPFLILHGEQDHLVPMNQAERMLAALKEKGIPAELVRVQNGGHGLRAEKPGDPAAVPDVPAQQTMIGDFFDRVLKH